jgi:hypothetical protein
MNKLQIIAELDFLHYCLERIINDADTRSPIAKMIDKATGFDAVKDREKIKNVLCTLRQIRNRKKKIGMDIELEKKTIKDLKELQMRAK